ncbi:ATP-binding protein [Pseudoalteromonas spongiae]|uniref:ATP-binding protein n=1 Tax=Pseudoalteromonas spongiae TaxID=298657 RepID=UPI00110A842E|nr:ATP-binding protein [Pseudoalteromonas spongiae]TMO82806.1 hybrid sensor histidine kinase/response regulator [Pseudoalteromonas spongiae]
MFNKIVSSIASKITLALVVVFAILVISYFIMSQRLNSIEKSVQSTAEISHYSLEILKTSKDIVELQRDINVYGVSGSASIFDKIKENFLSIETRLNSIASGKIHPSEQMYIDAMLELIVRYKSNLPTFHKRHEIRESLLEKALPNTYFNGVNLLNSLKAVAITPTEKQYSLELIDKWHSLHHDALLYLNKKDYSKRQNVENIFKLLSKLNYAVSNDRFNEKLAEVSNISAQYAKVFRKSIQANRNYLTLVNVVMSGDSIEFSSLANRLRESSLQRLSKIKLQSDKNINEAESILSILSIGIFCYLVLLAIFIQSHVSFALKRLTSSFSSFLKGDFSAPIEDLNRRDEIGKLAHAADRFRLLSKALNDAKLEAERVSKVKSEFLANMSHEIRTPMNGILGMARQLEGTPLTSEQSSMLNIIQSSGDSLLVIINDILDLSKIEASKIELEHTVVDLTLLLNELEQLFVHQALDKGIQLFVSKSEDTEVLFYADKTRLKQVLINLLGNAIKFTEVGSVSLNVHIHEKNNELVLSFSVSDTGIGISEDNIKDLFEAFSQADTSITRRFGGTGLGLTISSKLLNLMDAPLQVKSELGKGTQFYFDFKTKRAKSIERAEISTDDITLDLNLSHLSVLVVEDNEINQIVIEALLKEFNITDITIASDGVEAIEECKFNAFDIVLMDMQMPIMGGEEAAQHIRKMINHVDTPIIALTANVLKEDRQRCFDSGMDDFVSKPINFDSLKGVLTKWSNKANTN